MRPASLTFAARIRAVIGVSRPATVVGNDWKCTAERVCQHRGA